MHQNRGMMYRGLSAQADDTASNGQHQTHEMFQDKLVADIALLPSWV